MTLVMSAGLGSLFTVMTSDKRLALRVNENEYKAIEDEKEVKCFSLTDKVIFGWGGHQALAKDIENKLREVIKPEYTLEQCKKALAEVTEDMYLYRQGVGVAILLSGFYHDGSTGMILLKSGAPIKEIKKEPYEYRYAILPPTGDYSDRQRELFHIEEFISEEAFQESFKGLDYNGVMQKAIQITVNHLLQLQGIISFQQYDEVTSDGFYYVLYRNVEGQLQLMTGEFDTKMIHDQLKK